MLVGLASSVLADHGASLSAVAGRARAGGRNRRGACGPQEMGRGQPGEHGAHLRRERRACGIRMRGRLRAIGQVGLGEHALPAGILVVTAGGPFTVRDSLHEGRRGQPPGDCRRTPGLGREP
ncbi:MAG: hypothetical protein IPO18_10500 [bacterium]|nr:hypothetical protein [bacterium]